MAVALGLLFGCLIVVGVGWVLLDHLLSPTWDGDVHFIVESLPRDGAGNADGQPVDPSYVIVSVGEETPLALYENSSGRMGASLKTSEISGLQVGDRLLCTVHVDSSGGGRGAGQPLYRVTNCRRA
ncbi:hypothetical protein OHB26_37895 [Nocardia sp. NBC_01503]|uniref:hypothetical protein n=1 Tax=Nocardia sp. NBC_01503 TaxID=2975997 RepID=UPI002E7B8B97|nr:hypothetical protein [Nocardia sp. NBC_01503]WTL32557.1 hypothetical protein OHB26_37895 [Nocardia sp. NBC_01503]